MSEKQYDAIVIGAGVIGCAIAFELARKGYKTVNIDRQPDAGHGSTSNSCAIVRAHYSTWDGVAMAYEGFFYWKDWERYLGVEDERGFARYMNTGTILLKTKGHDHQKVLDLYRELGVEHEVWDLDTLKERMPIYAQDSYYPPKLPDDPHFFDEPTDVLEGAIYTPGSGYVNDPQLATHNLRRAAEHHGSEFMFNSEIVEVRRDAERVQGVT
ncbi:MAG: NAD(P)/FAD-dependent oxidoreductase, partial [Anaerolineales bacterium]